MRNDMTAHVFEKDFILELKNAQYKDGVLYNDEFGFPDEMKMVNTDGTPLTNYTAYNDTKLFHVHQPLNTVRFAKIKYERPVEGYESVNGDLKNIDEETYEKLTASFKKKYQKVQGEKIAIEKPIRMKPVSYHTPFDMAVYTGEKEHILRSEYRSSLRYDSHWRELREGFHNFETVAASPEIIVAVLIHLYAERAEQGVGKQHRPGFRSYSGLYSEDSSYVTVDYFAEPWDGKHKKQYHRKKNGGTYADGRHDKVPDYPETVSYVHLQTDDLRNIPFDKCKNNNDVLAVIEQVYEVLFEKH